MPTFPLLAGGCEEGLFLVPMSTQVVKDDPGGAEWVTEEGQDSCDLTKRPPTPAVVTAAQT